MLYCCHPLSPVIHSAEVLVKIALLRFAQLVSETNREKNGEGGDDFEGRFAAKQTWKMEELGWNVACVPLLCPK